MQSNMLGQLVESREGVSSSDEQLPKESFTQMVEVLTEIYKGWEGVTQFKGTADRLTRMYSDFCWSPDKIKRELDTHTKLFEDGYEEVMTISDIAVVTLCPHHLLPCDFKVSITYSPNGKVLGLSKFARIAVILGKHPVMQEMYTRELADTLFERVKPIGVKVIVTGTHGCLKFRGAQQDAPVVTEQRRGNL
jgi:GTP cyclohydrolase I